MVDGATHIVYVNVESGFCDDIAGRTYVEDKGTCEAAARKMKALNPEDQWMDDTTADEYSENSDWHPRGCYRNANNFKLVFNTDASSPAKCNALPYGRACICRLEQHDCSVDDGSAPFNNAPCRCGNVTCTNSTTGGSTYCVANASACSAFAGKPVYVKANAGFCGDLLHGEPILDKLVCNYVAKGVYADSDGATATTGFTTFGVPVACLNANMYCFADTLRCSYVPDCPAWNLTDHADLHGRGGGLADGVNYVQEGCGMGHVLNINGNQTYKIAAHQSAAHEVVLDRKKKGRHFLVHAGGTLEVTGLTLTGGGQGELFEQFSLGGGGTFYGGAVYILGSGMFSNCTFTGSSEIKYGGAVAIGNGGSGTFSSCTFTGNSASEYGGAIAIGNGGSGTFSSCTFTGNSASEYGGAIAIGNGGSGTFSSCTFTGNSASEYGGAIAIGNGGSGTFSSCTFTGNSASEYGGAIAIGNGGSGTFSSCTFTGNSASEYGGAIAIGNGGSATLIESNITGNNSTDGKAFSIVGEDTPSNALTLLNMVAVQPNPIYPDESRSKLATCTPIFCADKGFPAHNCVDVASLTPNRITCTPDPSTPIITTIAPTTASDCTNDHADKPLHLSGCDATFAGISITIIGVNFNQPFSGSHTNRVTLDNTNCSITSWSATEIVCTPSEAARVGTALAVIVHTQNGKKTSQSPMAKLLSFKPPTISSIDPARSTVAGGVVTTFTGTNFGPASLGNLYYDDVLAFTSITHVSDTKITAVSPALSGTHAGHAGLNTTFIIGRQAATTSAFSYTAPTLTRVDLLAQAIVGNATGIPMTVHGTEFADVDSNQLEIFATKSGADRIECSSEKQLSLTKMTCMFPYAGLVGYKVFARISGQNTVQDVDLTYCADAELQTFTGTDALSSSLALNVEEGQSVTYKAQLAAPLAAETGTMVTINTAIASSSVAYCTLKIPTSTVQRAHGDYDTPFEVTVASKITDGDGTHECNVEHTITSTDECYKAVHGTVVKTQLITITPEIRQLDFGKVLIKETGTNTTMVERTIVEGSATTFSYDVVLDRALEDDAKSVVVTIVSSNPEACALGISALDFTNTNENTKFDRPRSVTITLTKDNEDQPDGAPTNNLFATCDLTHTIDSTDKAYDTSEVVQAVLKIRITDDDVADTKLRPTTITTSFDVNNGAPMVGIEDFKVKFLGPLTLVEGASDTYGVQLDTRPTADVIVRLNITKPRSNTPANVVVSPSTFTFRPDEWNESQVQLATITVNDDAVDSAQDTEDFTLTHFVSTTDAVYSNKFKVTSLIVVVRVQDDDTAGVVLDGGPAGAADVLALTEGESVGATFTVTGLSSAPLHDVTLKLTTSKPGLMTVEPSSIVVTKEDWNSVAREVRVRALQGQYGGTASATITVTPESADPKYNTSAARMTKTAAITLSKKENPGLIGVPAGLQRWAEGGSFRYSAGLNFKPAEGVTVSVTVTSNNKTLCEANPSTFSFTASNWDVKEITIKTRDDGRNNLARDTVSYNCSVSHHIETSSAIGITNFSNPVLTLHVLSSGCGRHEYLGECDDGGDRGHFSRRCICNEGYFLPSSSECTECPKRMSVCNAVGLEFPGVAPGFWRAVPTSPDLEADPFYKCTHARACVGWDYVSEAMHGQGNTTSDAACASAWRNPSNVTTLDKQCDEHSTGVTCALCKDGFVKTSAGLCTPCGDPNVPLAIGIFLLLVAVLTVVTSILVFRVKATSSEEAVAGTMAAERRPSSDVKDYMIVLLAIMVSWMQILSAVIVSADAVEWPPAFVSFASTLGIVNLDLSGLLPVASCTLILPNHVKMALHLATPIAVVCSVLFAAFVAKKLSGASSRKRWHHQVNLAYKITITIVLLIYPSIATRLFQAFRCFKVEDNYYLEADFGVICWESGEHSAYIAVALVYLLFFVVGVPLFLLWELWRHREYLHNPMSRKHGQVKDRLGSVYEDFEPEYWFFETCTIIVKMLLAGALSVIAPHSPLQLFVGLVICLAFLLMIVHFAPYREDGHDVLSFVAYLSLTFTMLIGALKSSTEFERAESRTGYQWQNIDSEMLGAMLIMINTSPIVCALVLVAFRVTHRGTRRNTRSGTRLTLTSVLPKSVADEDRDEAAAPGYKPARNKDNNDNNKGEGTMATVRPSTMAAIASIQDSYHAQETQLQEEHARQSARQKRRTQLRLLLRMQLRQTQALKKVPAFASLDDDAISKVVERMKFEKLAQGDLLCQEGDDADTFYVLMQGQCTVTVGGITVGSVHRLEFVGETALASSGGVDAVVRIATVVVKSESATVLSLSRTDFAALVADEIVRPEVMAAVREVREARVLANMELLGAADDVDAQWTSER
eukprot:g2793.t1